jgi:hypothetical protein
MLGRADPMSTWLRYWQGPLLFAAAVVWAGPWAKAETCTLELKRLPEDQGRAVIRSPQDMLLQQTSPQRFYMSLGSDSRIRFPGSEGVSEFSKVIKKEPQYKSKHPLRGVARLGSQEYGFAVDAVPAEKAAEKGKSPKYRGELDQLQSSSGEKKAARKPKSSKAKKRSDDDGPASEAERAGDDSAPPEDYCRLYFDFNHNGDLTDDKVIEGKRDPRYAQMPSGYSTCQFPRIDLPIEAEGTTFDYSFYFSVMAIRQRGFSYAYASLNAAAYREGQITIDGKPHTIVLVDNNSNGRFDDELKLREGGRASRGVLSTTEADVLMLDPAATPAYVRFDLTSNDVRQQLSRLLEIDGRFYRVKVTPAGDRLTLTPWDAAVGYVKNPAWRFRAVVWGDEGALKVRSDEGKPVPLPEGQWRLLEYTIEQPPERPKPPPESKAKGKKKAKAGSLLDALAAALEGTVPGASPLPAELRNSTVSAQATGASRPIAVRKGQTTVLPFGPPYKPVVKCEFAGGGQAQLSLSLIGSGGEQCTAMSVQGSNPPAPKFKITDDEGEVAAEGRFAYG